MENCILCGKSDLKPADYVEPWDHILYRSENFIAFPAMGSMIEGWMLIATQRHELCVGALSEEQLDELQEFSALVAGHLRAHYGPITLFEQGPARPLQTAGGGVWHAHLNLLPFSSDLTAGAMSLYPQYKLWRKVDGMGATKSVHREGLAYLYIDQPGHPKYILPSPDLPSQIARRAIAAELMMEAKYDWRSNPFVETARATLKTLSGASQHKQTIPK